MNQKTSPRIRRREFPPVMQGRTGYRNAVPYLRRDFDFRCAYCGIHEQMKGGPQAFCIDHFKCGKISKGHGITLPGSILAPMERLDTDKTEH